MPDILPPTDLYLDGFKGPRVTPVAPYAEQLKVSTGPYEPTPTWEERRALRKQRLAEKGEKIVEEGLQTWKPAENPNATTEPMKTLFVGRLAYDVTERQLRREFEVYGEITEVKLINDTNTGKFKGYAFLQFAKEEDMKAAYKDADAKKVNGRRIVVDVERGRTVKNWRPKRLGGGLGKTRAGDAKVNQTYSGRESRSTESGERKRSLDRHRSHSPGDDRRQRPRTDSSAYRHRR